MTFVSSALSILAVGLAPMSLVAPLSGLTVLLNLLMTPYFLGERLHVAIDLPVALLIVVGAGCTSVFGPHKERSYNADVIQDLLSSQQTVVYVLVSILVVTLCELEMRRSRRNANAGEPGQAEKAKLRGMMLTAFVAAVCAGLSGVGMKAAGGMARIKFHGVGEATPGFVIAVTTISLMAALFELNVISRGLWLYEQTVFLPVSKALNIISNTMMGLFIYEEFGELRGKPLECVFFFGGVVIMAAGIFLLSFRRAPVSSHSDQVPLLAN